MTADAPTLKKYLGQVSLPEVGTVGMWTIKAATEEAAHDACAEAARPVVANCSGGTMADAVIEVAEVTRTYRRPKGWTVGHDDSIACPHRSLSVCPACVERYSDRVVEVYGTHAWMASDAERTLMLASMTRTEALYGAATVAQASENGRRNAEVGDTPEQRAAAFDAAES